MSIAFENFTPLSAATGGALIGLAAVILMAFNGRIAGISGIFSGLLFSQDEKSWRWMFVAGLVLGPILYRALIGQQVEFNITGNWWLIVIGGVLVGFGTRLGFGCTSGHGVCGLARLSVRSLVAVITFMASGIATVAVIRLIAGA